MSRNWPWEESAKCADWATMKRILRETRLSVPNCTSGFRYVVDFMERETGIEPATFSLGS